MSVNSDPDYKQLAQYANLQLIACGLQPALSDGEQEFVSVAKGLLQNYHEKARLLDDERAPVDERIEDFLAEHCSDLDLDERLRLPSRTLELNQPGLARVMSLPAHGDHIKNSFVESFRVKNGVLHNPRHDRRTTKGTFHVVEGGLPIPGDKISVPKSVFAKLFQIAMNPPNYLKRLPFTDDLGGGSETFVSLLIRPIVCPEVPGVCREMRMETRFFAPGCLISNLDFVESIFGNAGDPLIPQNDSALDVEHWTGHTGCVILAPQMSSATKESLGLPNYDDATERQRQDGMCWKQQDELYNDGLPFKITCRTEAGVIVTIIADNYFGYCKKEVKTQISYAANLYGNTEEEHAGGAIAYASWSLGDDFDARKRNYNDRTFQEVAEDYEDFIDLQPEGYGIDKNYPNLIYIPETAEATTGNQCVTWEHEGTQQSIPLLPGRTYMTPSGYKMRMEKHPAAPSWRLIGTTPEGVFCHKPCTVSGGGKSEISKSLVDYMLYGPIFVSNLEEDFELVQHIFDKDYSSRWREEGLVNPDYSETPSRRVLDTERSLGSLIKLLTPSSHYTEEYNDWLESIPNYIYAIVFIIKRFQLPNWEKNWRKKFRVDIVNGLPGHELKFGDRTLVGFYLRLGFQTTSEWRTYKLRQDFAAASKIQTEDDISASVVVPANQVTGVYPERDNLSHKFVINCEDRLFQRPDDAIHRGLDKQTELDLASANNFISNFEPLTFEDVHDMLEKVVDFDAFSKPMQKMLREVDESGSGYVVCSANPRQIDGKPTKNPRYLQLRPDLSDSTEKYVAAAGSRLFRAIPVGKPVPTPVDAVLAGRRNNPRDAAAGVRGLAVFNPIHFQELPELFMDFVCSLTGKSPSTTGFGSEGALTKGPFNALRPTIDLNTALVSYIVTGLHGYTTAAGFIGADIQVDHDISLLVPEIWCRLLPEERDPYWLISEGLLEKLDDFEYNDQTVLGSRLGYRINERFVRRFFGRVFDNPSKVFDEAILKPETQDFDAYADGINYITEAHERVARRYFDVGSIDDACPPLKALLSIMAYGEFEGKGINDPQIREMFTKDYLLKSDWYQERLRTKQQRDVALHQRHFDNLDKFLKRPTHTDEAERLQIRKRQKWVQAELKRIASDKYLKQLNGTLGAEPL